MFLFTTHYTLPFPLYSIPSLKGPESCKSFITSFTCTREKNSSLINLLFKVSNYIVAFQTPFYTDTRNVSWKYVIHSIYSISANAKTRVINH